MYSETKTVALSRKAICSMRFHWLFRTWLNVRIEEEAAVAAK